MIFDLFFDLFLVLSFHIGFGSKNLQYNLLAVLIPIISEVDFGVGTFIDFLFHFIPLVDHDSLVEIRSWHLLNHLHLLVGLLQKLLLCHHVNLRFLAGHLDHLCLDRGTLAVNRRQRILVMLQPSCCLIGLLVRCGHTPDLEDLLTVGSLHFLAELDGRAERTLGVGHVLDLDLAGTAFEELGHGLGLDEGFEHFGGLGGQMIWAHRQHHRLLSALPVLDRAGARC